jgi:hypothetical protein
LSKKMKTPFFLLVLLLLPACATTNAPLQSQPVRLTFDAINPTKYKSEQEREAAKNIDYEGCKAAALQTALNTPQQTNFAPAYIPPPASTYVQNTTIVARPSNGPVDYSSAFQAPNAGAVPNAFQAGLATGEAIDAVRMRQELAKSIFVSCMGQRGWALRQ